ncbi:MAG: energy transducer TonB, partial [Chitinophagaceae bacterium]
MEANKILSSDLLDLLFEDRNKDYGAYELRKNYNNRVAKSLLITGVITAAIFVYGYIARSLAPANAANLYADSVILRNIPPEEQKKVEPPPLRVKQEFAKLQTKQFTPIKIVKDADVKREDIPPEIDKLQESKIDVVSKDGIKDEGIATPVVDNGKGIIEIPKEETDEPFVKIEEEASFPGGIAAWKKYLERNLNASAPVENGANPGSYTVMVQFIVSKDGSISDVKSLTSHGYGMEEEAVRVIRKGPKWIPAIQNGRNV